MPFFTYIIQSETDQSYYIGSCEDIPLRLQRHNEGWSRYTKRKIPWKLVYSESFNTKSEAIKRELEIKRMKSREYILRLIRHAGGRPDGH